LLLTGHKARADKAMLEQTRNPFGILHIRFSRLSQL